MTDKYIISEPYIDPKDFFLHATVFETYMEAYNTEARERRKNGEKVQLLRGTHRETFFALVRMYSKQLKSDAMVFSDTPELMAKTIETLNHLYTNRLDYYNETRKDGSTFYRHLQRFLELGIITQKIWHGTRSNFELVLNPDFFLVRDAKNKAYRPESQWLQNALSQSGFNAKCTLLTISEMNKLKKEIMDVNNVDKESSINEQSIREQDTNIETVKGECLDNAGINQQHSSKTSEQNTPPVALAPPLTEEQKLQASFIRYKYATARTIVLYAIEKLWPGKVLWTNEEGTRTISDSELDRTIEGVYHWYVKDVDNNYSVIDNRFDFTKRIILKSLRNLQKNGYRQRSYENRTDLKTWFVYPFKYFNPEYTKGFNTSLTWMSQDWIKKQSKIQRTAKQKAIDNAVRKYHKQSDPDKLGTNRTGYAEYRRQEAYIRKNHPQQLNEFLNRTLTNPRYEQQSA